MPFQCRMDTALDAAFVRHFAAYILQWSRCGGIEELVGTVEGK